MRGIHFTCTDYSLLSVGVSSGIVPDGHDGRRCRRGHCHASFTAKGIHSLNLDCGRAERRDATDGLDGRREEGADAHEAG